MHHAVQSRYAYGLVFAATSSPWAVGAYRHRSRRPLFVTAAGMPQERAARHIERMHGGFRIPTMLKRVDPLCRNAQLWFVGERYAGHCAVQRLERDARRGCNSISVAMHCIRWKQGVLSSVAELAELNGG